MTEQINTQNLSDIISLIEENNAALRNAILALEIVNNRILLRQNQDSQPSQDQQPNQDSQPDKDQQPNQSSKPTPSSQVSQNNYPGYTTPPRFGFMGQ